MQPLPLRACTPANDLLQRTLFGLFFVILLVEIAYLAFSWDRAVFMMQSVGHPKKMTQLNTVVFFCSRFALIISTVLFLALLRCKPVGKEEQVRSLRSLHMVLRVTSPAEIHAFRFIRPLSGARGRGFAVRRHPSVLRHP